MGVTGSFHLAQKGKINYSWREELEWTQEARLNLNHLCLGSATILHLWYVKHTLLATNHCDSKAIKEKPTFLGDDSLQSLQIETENWGSKIAECRGRFTQPNITGMRRRYHRPFLLLHIKHEELSPRHFPKVTGNFCGCFQKAWSQKKKKKKTQNSLG